MCLASFFCQPPTRTLPLAAYQILVQWQDNMYVEKCEMSGNRKLFPFFYSYGSADAILAGWELDAGLAFYGSKMAAKMANTPQRCIYWHIFCSRHSRIMVLVYRCMFFMLTNLMLWLCYQLLFAMYNHVSNAIAHSFWSAWSQECIKCSSHNYTTTMRYDAMLAVQLKKYIEAGWFICDNPCPRKEGMKQPILARHQLSILMDRM